jgi:hypothetical protein
MTIPLGAVPVSTGNPAFSTPLLSFVNTVSVFVAWFSATTVLPFGSTAIADSPRPPVVHGEPEIAVGVPSEPIWNPETSFEFWFATYKKLPVGSQATPIGAVPAV